LPVTIVSLSLGVPSLSSKKPTALNRTCRKVRQSVRFGCAG
jgi:hypothetical protein